MPTRIRIATRSSALAMWQAEFVAAKLEATHAGLAVELVALTTAGDRWLSAPLSEVGGKGLFIKELEVAMLEDRADVAVHSMKDLPGDLPPQFELPVIAFRDDVRDALVSGEFDSIAALPRGARIGSSSLRRRAQLLARRPDLEIVPVRGNVNTRLRKLDAGEYDALLLACAGLDRLDLSARVKERIAIRDSLPAAGQGALGVECRADRADIIELMAPLADPVVARCVAAERAVSAALGGNCSMPLAAYARMQGDAIVLDALLADVSGTRVLRAQATGTVPADVGATAAALLVAQGANTILDALRAQET